MARVLCLGVAAATLATGCSAVERVCNPGEDPLLALTDGRLDGGLCIPEGTEPPPGFVRYPDDLVPTLLKDEPAARAEFQRRLDAEAGS